MELFNYQDLTKQTNFDKNDFVSTQQVPATRPAFLPARAVEGRYGRLHQGRRPITADIRYPDPDPLPDAPDVMDLRSYTSYPAVQPRLRRKDEWHDTSDNVRIVIQIKNFRIIIPFLTISDVWINFVLHSIPRKA